MIKSINSPDFKKVIVDAKLKHIENIAVGGVDIPVQIPFASPEDWRDQWIYFLMTDRFSHHNAGVMPKHQWDDPFGDFQGGTFNGITKNLDYIKSLGAGAIWITPPFKNCSYECSYYGYGIQNFISIDPRFGSDGTEETAERELRNMVLQAHARGLYVIFDIVLNHAGSVFLYDNGGQLSPSLNWRDSPYDIKWRDAQGNGQWTSPPAPESCHTNACIWPAELQNSEYFRRKGEGGESGGDFGSLKEFVTEYYRYQDGYYYRAVWDALIKAYQYAIAKYDIDGFRIDTLKYIEREFAQSFANSIREFAMSIGKRNFFTFGEVWDSEAKITQYIGRYSSDEDGVIGVDAALDFPLFGNLSATVKGFIDPAQIARIFEDRKQYQKSHIGYHGEAGKFFVTFLDNHDQHERFYYKDGDKYDLQVPLGVGALFTLQGIPCLYYGTEQGLHGRGGSLEAVREALWGKDNGLDQNHPFYKAIQKISQVRAEEPALRYGRQYFREVSQNGNDFGIPTEKGGILAYARILDDQEILAVMNTNADISKSNAWAGDVIVDYALNSASPPWRMLYSNLKTDDRELATRKIPDASVQKISGEKMFGPVRSLSVTLKPMEIQILKKG